MIPDISLVGVSVLVLVGIIVEIIKRIGVATRYIPAVSVVIGIGLGIAAYFTGSIDLVSGIVGGGLVGASVSGVYDLGKKTILNK